MADNIRKKVTNNRDISYLNRDFESLRNELVRYSKTHYGDKILDFSESSLAGMFVDMAAYVGDVMSHYLDHQFNELNLETAIEENNIARLIRQSGVEIIGNSPSYVELDCTLRVNSVKDNNGNFKPDPDELPVVKLGTIVTSTTGINFELLDNIDFSEKLQNGEYSAKIIVANSDDEGNPLSYLVSRKAFFTSAKTTTETFSIPDTFQPFRSITLKNGDVNEIISVHDADGDEYYEVQSLTQNTVFLREKNTLKDYLSVPERIKMIPAPKRFEKFASRETGKTTIRFGSGNEDVFDEDIVPDPSEHAIKLYGNRKTLQYATIDPNSFLSSRTLGISPKNTTISVRYRYGGGLSHNVPANQITSVKTLDTKFQSGVNTEKITRVRASFSVNNNKSAKGGENEPTLNELKQIAINARNSQNRIVTKEDLIARVYSIPNNFGRVFRAGLRDNPFNPFSSHLHLISRNDEGKLTLCSDSLKENVSVYLSKYRLITDAIDIVDAVIVNLRLDFVITIDNKSNSEIVVQTINAKLSEYFNIGNFQIDQPIYIAEIQNLIINTLGVVSLIDLNFTGLSGKVGSNSYSPNSYSPLRYLDKGVLYPPAGGIFEIKFPTDDIRGTVN